MKCYKFVQKNFSLHVHFNLDFVFILSAVNSQNDDCFLVTVDKKL